jgi:hypothetical protein
MGEPIVFVVRNRIREGKLDEFVTLYRAAVPRTEAGKPGTLVQLAYLSQDGTEATIVRLFPSAEALDAHLQGAKERSRAAYRLIAPTGIEVYCAPTRSTIQKLRQIAGLGIDLHIHPQYIGGLIRPTSGQAGEGL